MDQSEAAVPEWCGQIPAECTGHVTAPYARSRVDRQEGKGRWSTNIYTVQKNMKEYLHYL